MQIINCSFNGNTAWHWMSHFHIQRWPFHSGVTIRECHSGWKRFCFRDYKWNKCPLFLVMCPWMFGLKLVYDGMTHFANQRWTIWMINKQSCLPHIGFKNQPGFARIQRPGGDYTDCIFHCLWMCVNPPGEVNKDTIYGPVKPETELPEARRSGAGGCVMYVFVCWDNRGRERVYNYCLPTAPSDWRYNKLPETEFPFKIKAVSCYTQYSYCYT